MIVFQAHKKQFAALAFSPDSTQLATAGETDSVYVWESPYESPRVLIGWSGLSPGLTFSPDDSRPVCRFLAKLSDLEGEPLISAVRGLPDLDPSGRLFTP